MLVGARAGDATMHPHHPWFANRHPIGSPAGGIDAMADSAFAVCREQDPCKSGKPSSLAYPLRDIPSWGFVSRLELQTCWLNFSFRFVMHAASIQTPVFA